MFVCSFGHKIQHSNIRSAYNGTHVGCEFYVDYNARAENVRLHEFVQFSHENNNGWADIYGVNEEDKRLLLHSSRSLPGSENAWSHNSESLYALFFVVDLIDCRPIIN